MLYSLSYMFISITKPMQVVFSFVFSRWRDECYQVTPLFTCQLVNMLKRKLFSPPLRLTKLNSPFKGFTVWTHEVQHNVRLYKIIVILIININLCIIYPEMVQEQIVDSNSCFTHICLTKSVINSWFTSNDTVLFLYYCGWMRSWLYSGTRPLVPTFPAS